MSSAKDKASGKEQKVTITSSSGPEQKMKWNAWSAKQRNMNR